MPIQGHPPADLLDRFAAGELDLAPALVVETHIEACVHCRQRVQGRETEHGAALARLPDSPLRRDALVRALAALPSTSSEPPDHLGDVPLPEALRRRGFHARRFLSANYWVAPVRRARRDAWRAYVLRAPAGSAIPAHRHLGQEYFQVLMGEVSDGDRHASGDFVSGLANADHALNVSEKGPCACLIAVEHGARWRGVTRLVAPWLGV